MENDECRVVLGRRPGGTWTTVGRGVHRSGSPSLEADLRAWQAVLRLSAAFTHLTAAEIRGWWLPPVPTGVPVWVAQIASQTPSGRAGSVVSRHKVLPPRDVLDGLRVTTVAETLLACSRDLGLLDLVVLVDCVLHRGEATLDELWAVARQHRRGGPRLREALALADGRSESPWESLLRLLHVVCGVAVEPQHVVLDEAGGFVARADLWLVGTRTVHEYDGGHHLERAQQRRDLKRAGRLADAGFRRRGYTREDVLGQAVTILRDADAATGRRHDPRRVGAWHDLLRESLFTPAGTARFCARVGVEPPHRPDPKARQDPKTAGSGG